MLAKHLGDQILVSVEALLAELGQSDATGDRLRELRLYERAVDDVIDVAMSTDRVLAALGRGADLGDLVQRAVLADRFDQLASHLRELFGTRAIPDRFTNAEAAIRRLIVGKDGESRTVHAEFIGLTAGLGTLERAAYDVHLVVHSSALTDTNFLDEVLPSVGGEMLVLIPPPTMTVLSRATHASNRRVAERAAETRKKLDEVRADTGSSRSGERFPHHIVVQLGTVGQLLEDAPADLDTVFARTVQARAAEYPTAAVVAIAADGAEVLDHFRSSRVFAAVLPAASY